MLTISVRDLIFICLFAIIIIWLSGIGAAFPQSGDWHKHNAIIHDLITMEWPVHYDNGAYLNYYIIFYLLPVVIAKVFMFLGCSYNIVFNISNFVYCSLIFILILLLLKQYCLYSRKKFYFFVTIIIFFGGLDILANTTIDPYNNNAIYHLECYFNRSGICYEFNNSFTQLEFVYVQMLPTWLLVLSTLLSTKKFYFYFITLLFVITPFPGVGFGILLFFKIIFELISKKAKILNYITLENILYDTAIHTFYNVFYK